jgi:hypothetical protein
MHAHAAFSSTELCATSNDRSSHARRSASQREYATRPTVYDDLAYLTDDDYPKKAVDVGLVLQQVCNTG